MDNVKLNNFETKILKIFWDEVANFKNFLFNFQKVNHDIYSKIMLLFLWDNKELVNNAFNNYISLRANYIIYSFLHYQDNKFNLNDCILESRSSWFYSIFDYINFIELNFFIDSSSLSLFNIEIDKILIWEILKTDSNSDFSNNSIINKWVLIVLEDDFRKAISNWINRLEINPSSDRLRTYLKNEINNSIKTLSNFLIESNINWIKWVTKSNINKSLN